MKKFDVKFGQLILAILLISTSGVLGRSVDVSPELTIASRCILGAVALLAVAIFTKQPLYISIGKPFYMVALSTVFLGVHWICYFYALYYSSVAVGMLSLFTFPMITVLLEPLITKSKFNPWDFLLASMAFIGLFFLVPAFDLDNQVTRGVVFGVVSAVAYALRNLILKLHVKDHSGITIMWMQLAGLSVLFSPILFFGGLEINLTALALDWKPLLLLGVVTTAIGHTALVFSFKKFPVSMVSILSSLMPLLGICWGMLFLGEYPAGKVWIGGGLIGVAVVVESLKAVKNKV